VRLRISRHSAIHSDHPMMLAMSPLFPGVSADARLAGSHSRNVGWADESSACEASAIERKQLYCVRNAAKHYGRSQAVRRRQLAACVKSRTNAVRAPGYQLGGHGGEVGAVLCADDVSQARNP